MGAHDDAERLIADSQFGAGGTSFAPGTWHVGLSTTTPNDDGSGATEPPTSAGYSRVAMTNNSTNWPAATTVNGETTKQNGVKATFPNPTGPWGLCTHFLLFTSATGGTPRYSVALDQPISPRSGNTPVEFDIGAMVLPWS